MILYFGQEDKYSFYPLKSDGLTEMQAVSAPESIYLFNGLPTIEDAINGTTKPTAELLETISAWTNTPDGFGKQFTIPRQEDPDPSSNTYKRDYYLAINVKVEAGDDTDQAPIIKKVTFTRLRSQESKLLITNGDLYSVAPQMKKFVCAEGLEDHIETAIDEVRTRFNTFDTSFADIKNPHLLNNAVKYLAISNFFFSQARGQGSIEFVHYEHFKEKYKEQLRVIQLEISAQGEVEPKQIDGANKGYFSSLRVIR